MSPLNSQCNFKYNQTTRIWGRRNQFHLSFCSTLLTTFSSSNGYFPVQVYVSMQSKHRSFCRISFLINISYSPKIFLFFFHLTLWPLPLSCYAEWFQPLLSPLWMTLNGWYKGMVTTVRREDTAKTLIRVFSQLSDSILCSVKLAQK